MNEHITRIAHRIGVVGATAAFAAIALHGSPAPSLGTGGHLPPPAGSSGNCADTRTVKGGLGWDGLCPNPV